MPSLSYEIVGLSPQASRTEVAQAFEEKRLTALHHASHGDKEAGRRLAELRYSYLRWAYGDRPAIIRPSCD